MQDIHTARLLIQIGVGIVMILFGLSQITSPDKWLKYLPRFVRFIMPVKPTNFMRAHSLGNLGLGILLAIGVWQPAVIWITIFWWISILPFAFYAEYSIGLRDVAIILSLIGLLLLQNA